MKLEGFNNVYLIGDAAGPPFLAHRAIIESIGVFADIMGVNVSLPRVYPQVVYTDPEIVEVVGGRGSARYRLYWSHLPVARIASIRIAYAEIEVSEDDRIVAVRLVGPHVSELAAYAALLVERGVKLRELLGVSHPHPTSSESILEVVLEALGLMFNKA